MTSPEIDHVSFLVEHAQTVFAGEYRNLVPRVRALPLSSGTRVTRTLGIERDWPYGGVGRTVPQCLYWCGMSFSHLMR